MSSKIQQVLETLKDAQKLADTDPGSVPYNVRPGFTFRISEAQRQLTGLTEELLALTVPDRCLAVFAEGDKDVVQALADMLIEYDELVLDAGKLYRDLAATIEPAFTPDRIFNTSQFALLVTEFQNRMIDLGVERPDVFEYKDGACFTVGDTVKHVRTLVRSAVGDDLLLRTLKKQIVDAVIAADLDGPKLPIFVIGADPVEIPALSGLFSKSKTRTFAAGTKVTPELAGGLFESFKTKPEKPAKKEEPEAKT